MKALSLFTCTLVVSCLLLEGLARLAGFGPRAVHVNPFFVAQQATSWSMPDPDLGWINKPGVAVSIGENQAPMTFWDFSRRASRPEPAVPEGKRIPVMVVGGSDAQSYGVTDAETFAAILARRYSNLWIENFGTGGYNSVQAMMLGERAYAQFYPPEAKPKLILLTISDSHLERNVSDQSWIFSVTDPQGRYFSPPHDRLRNGALAFVPFRTIAFWPLERHSALVTLAHDTWLRRIAYNTRAEGVPVTRLVLRQFADFAAKQGAMFAVVVLLDGRGVMADVLRDEPYPHKDCSGLDRTDPKDYILAGNGHPNAALHAHLAECVAGWLDTDILPRLGAPSAPSSP